MKRCPPGVICIENATIVTYTLLMFAAVFVVYYTSSTKATQTVSPQQQPQQIHPLQSEPTVHTPIMKLMPSWTNFNTNMFRRFRPDVLLNPYDPPLNDLRYPVIHQASSFNNNVNVSTNIGSTNAAYRQVGILNSLNSNTGSQNVLPLMGRPLFVNRNKWQYYTISNQQNNVKLPVSVNGRSALNEYGVDMVSNGDTIYVEGINEPHLATIYDTDTIRYM
jgi:hypothetical protein